MVTKAIKRKMRDAKERNIQRIIDRIRTISKIVEEKGIFDYIDDEKARKDKQIDLEVCSRRDNP